MRRKIYKFIKWIVVISFTYLFIFENKYNIDESIIKITNCKNIEVIYFKGVIFIIISLIIMIIDKYMNKDSYLYLDLNSYIKVRPLRSIALLIVILIFTLLVITILRHEELLTFVIFGILVFVASIIGFYIGKKSK